jgi:uncharacterized ferritin-like protein (DUF455 family)
VLEARGLDVTPATIDRFLAAGDEGTSQILKRILADEIRHVAHGTAWFRKACESSGILPESHWRHLVRLHFRGVLKPPFNDSAREAAGLPRQFYAPLA